MLKMTKRKSNLDLLRIVTMFGIIIFHHFGTRTLNHFVELTNGFTEKSYFYDFINNSRGYVSKLSLVMDFCYGHFGNGGNLIFMLITGYFLFGREISFSKRVRTAARILYALFFYGILLMLIHWFILARFYPISDYSSYNTIFKLPNWLSGENLWYLQAYGCFILVILPILKLFEKKLTRRTHLYLFLTLVCMQFLAYNTYLPNLWISTRICQFITFYYGGGYIAKYHVRVSPKKIAVIALVYLLIYFAYEYYWRLSCALMYKPAEYSFIDVAQPFVCCLIYALLWFLLFDNIDLQVPAPLAKALSAVSSKTMGIYIFHYNIISIAYIAANHLGWHNWSGKGFFLFILLDSMVIFAAGFLIDCVREWSYRLIENKIGAPLRERLKEENENHLR